MSFALMCAPALAYFVICLLARKLGRTHGGVLWNILVLTPAAAAASAMLWTISSAGPWRDHEQLAWTGLSTRKKPLVIGGEKSGNSIGWPSPPSGHQRFGPKVSIDESGGALTLSVSGIGGFVEHEDEVLNGTELGRHGTVDLNEFSIRRIDGDCSPCVIQIFDKKPVTREIEIRQKRKGEGRAIWLPEILEYEIDDLRGDRDKADKIPALRHWAKDIYLYGSKDGIRVLSPQSAEARRTIRSGSDIELVWPQLRLRVTLGSYEDRLYALFRAPFRHTSPLVPTATPEIESSQLRIGGQPEPGTATFLLPLGNKLESSTPESIALKDGHLPLVKRPELIPGSPPEPVDPLQTIDGLRGDAQAITMGYYEVYIAELVKIPSWSAFTWPSLCAFVTFAIALILLSLTFERDALFLSFSGVALVIWCFGCIRVMLAYRFALDPTSLDRVSIHGMHSAMAFWTVMPAGFCALAAGWRAFHRSDATPEQRILAFMTSPSALICVFLQHRWVVRAWPDVPSSWHEYGYRSPAIMVGVAMAALWVAYTPPRRGGRFTRLAILGERVLRLPAAVIRWFISSMSPECFWSRAPATARQRSVWSKMLSNPAVKWLIYAALVVSVVTILPEVWPVASRIVTQVLVSLLLILPIAWYWLRMRATDFGWRQVGGGALFMPSLLLLEAIVLAIFAHDVGGLVFIIAVMVPASIILLARGPRWPGVSLAASLIGMMLLGSVFVFGFPKLKLGGATAHRLLVYRNGIASQEYVWNRAAVEPVPGSFWKSPLERVLGRQIRPRSRAGEAILIRNTEQHLWAMSAWAYAGGWSGGGFGKSPTRRVQVPQDILQADSAYSFYVANEHGALGGAALLLLYALPMGFIFLFRADDELRFGGAFAAVLMGALFLDASAHVLMNLGWIPFTGRDLPLLSVNSGSDFMRFALLLALVAVSVQTDFGEGTWYLPGPGSRRFWRALEVVIFVSVLAVASSPFFDLVWTKTIRDKDGDYLVHDFGPGLQRLQEQFEDPNPDRWPLKLDPDSNRLVARDKRPETFLSQEIARFDEMSEGDRESGGRGAPESRDFWNDLARIKNRWSLECSETNCDGYLGILRYMRARYDNANEQPIDPPLFVVKPPDRYADVNHRVPGDEPEPRIEVNPAFNSVTSARVTSDPSELLHVSLKGARAGVWHVDGDHFHITVPDLEFHPDKTKPRGGITEVRVSLDDSSVTTKDLNESAFYLGFTCPRLPAKNQPGRAATFRVGDGSLWIEPGNIIWDIHLANSRPLRPARSNAPVRLKRGDWADTPSSFCGSKHWLTIGHTDFGSLIGPAWVMGEYATAYQPDSGIPWLSELRTALEIEHLHHNQGTKLPSVLSIDPRLQELASNFISKQGVELHEKLISEVCVDVRTKTGNNDCHVPAKKAFRRLVEDKLPPRVGIVVMRLSCSEKDCNSNGEIIASAGWPHASEQDGWVSSSDDVLPSARWIDLRAPDLVARRYEADRNFERIVVGSASKPIWATAVLRTNPRLRDLWVKGGDERKFERSVFGIDVSEGRRGYELRPCSENLWCGFNCYLACSDNRYQVTLNFLGLANTGDDHGIQVDRELPAWKHESFDEGRTNWSKLPDFGNIGFSSISLSTLLLDQQPLAKALRDRFRIYVTRQQHPEYRFSFWTGNAEDDPTPDYESPSRKDPLGTAFRFITPVATNLELNRIVRPRDLISVLLGGETNLWSNVELIGAFSSAVTGRAVLPHIVVTKDLSVPRQDDNKVAQRLQNALKEVLDPKPIGRRGHTYMGTGHDLKDLWEFAKKNHLQLFAKTGTLDTRVGAANIETEHQMSRFLLILAAKSSPHLERGLAISVFIERVAKDGEAARHWAQKFIIDNQVALLPYLR